MATEFIPLDPNRLTRRAFLGGTVGAVGSMALAQLLLEDAARADGRGSSALVPHHPATADSVICLFQHGGPSQVDLFDPKPELTKLHGKPYTKELEVHFSNQKGNCLASPFKFSTHGQSGMELSEII